LARCKVAENENWGIVLEKRTNSSISDGVKDLIKTSKKTSLARENGVFPLISSLLG